MCKGIIFNIQKFSIHDGPGIRTTVFFKGCPLQCQWCSNPESQLDNIQILHNKEKCITCQHCIHTCPQHAIELKDNKIIIDNKKCIGCLQCVNSCSQHALTSEGEYKTIQDIVDVCLQDKDFYEESRGGITISGGEGMSQPKFLKALIQELKKHDLHIAIETTGYVPHDIFQDIASMLDLLLFDIKHVDSDKHYQGTHVHNELIKKNFIWATENKIPLLPRIPVIPNFNDSLEDAEIISTFLKNANIKKVQLLPFHQFGEKKYELLNREYLYKDKKALYPENLTDYQNIFTHKGLDCYF